MKLILSGFVHVKAYIADSHAESYPQGGCDGSLFVKVPELHAVHGGLLRCYLFGSRLQSVKRAKVRFQRNAFQKELPQTALTSL